MAVHTGLRRSELCGLFWSEVNLKAQTLTVVRTMVSVRGDPVYIGEPESSASRRAPSFSETTAELLRDRGASLEELGLASQTQQVGTQGNGRMMIPGALSRGHKAIAESWGFFRLRFHDLRHTHATLLLT